MFVVKDVVSAVYWMRLERLARILTVVSWDLGGVPGKALGVKRPCRALLVMIVWMRTLEAQPKSRSSWSRAMSGSRAWTVSRDDTLPEATVKHVESYGSPRLTNTGR